MAKSEFSLSEEEVSKTKRLDDKIKRAYKLDSYQQIFSLQHPDVLWRSKALLSQVSVPV